MEVCYILQPDCLRQVNSNCSRACSPQLSEVGRLSVPLRLHQRCICHTGAIHLIDIPVGRAKPVAANNAADPSIICLLGSPTTPSPASLAARAQTEALCALGTPAGRNTLTWLLDSGAPRVSGFIVRLARRECVATQTACRNQQACR